MSDVNVQLVREFFELNGFRVMTYWQHDTVRPRAPDHGLQLFVENGAPVGARPSEFVLQPGDVAGVTHALVESELFEFGGIRTLDLEEAISDTRPCENENKSDRDQPEVDETERRTCHLRPPSAFLDGRVRGRQRWAYASFPSFDPHDCSTNNALRSIHRSSGPPTVSAIPEISIV